MWYADMKNKGVIGRGQPPKTVLGRKRKADVVIECRDRDFMELATGKVQAQRLYNEGRVSRPFDVHRRRDLRKMRCQRNFAPGSNAC
jgi:hypothetical protein